MLVEEVRHKQPRFIASGRQPENVCPPGEMLNEADDRVRTALVKLLNVARKG